MEVENGTEKKQTEETPQQSLNEEEVDDMKQYVRFVNISDGTRWDPMFWKSRTWKRRSATWKQKSHEQLVGLGGSELTVKEPKKVTLVCHLLVSGIWNKTSEG